MKPPLYRHMINLVFVSCQLMFVKGIRKGLSTLTINFSPMRRFCLIMEGSTPNISIKFIPLMFLSQKPFKNQSPEKICALMNVRSRMVGEIIRSQSWVRIHIVINLFNPPSLRTWCHNSIAKMQPSLHHFSN